MDRNRLLTIGAVLAAFVVVALGFIGGISPQLKAAATANANNTSVVSQNAALQAGITTLESKYSKLDSLTAELTDLQKSVPADSSSPAFINEINTLANKAGVSVTSLSMSDAIAYTPPVATTTGTTAGTAAAAAGTPPASPVAYSTKAITGSNFSVIPVSVTVSGTYGQALAFMSALHSGERLFLVTAFSGSNDSAANGTSGSWTVTGSIYALTAAASAQPSATTGTSTAANTTGSSSSSTDTAAGK